jgi:hypothetical protein
MKIATAERKYSQNRAAYFFVRGISVALSRYMINSHRGVITIKRRRSRLSRKKKISLP